jgi:hypothetical protein
MPKMVRRSLAAPEFWHTLPALVPVRVVQPTYLVYLWNVRTDQTFVEYNMGTNTVRSLAPIPLWRENYGMTAYADAVLICGGRLTHPWFHWNTCDLYNITTNVWSSQVVVENMNCSSFLFRKITEKFLTLKCITLKCLCFRPLEHTVDNIPSTGRIYNRICYDHTAAEAVYVWRIRSPRRLITNQ